MSPEASTPLMGGRENFALIAESGVVLRRRRNGQPRKLKIVSNDKHENAGCLLLGAGYGIQPQQDQAKQAMNVIEYLIPY